MIYHGLCVDGIYKGQYLISSSKTTVHRKMKDFDFKYSSDYIEYEEYTFNYHTIKSESFYLDFWSSYENFDDALISLLNYSYNMEQKFPKKYLTYIGASYDKNYFEN